MTTINLNVSRMVKRFVRRLIDTAQKAPYLGKGRYCPLCNNSSRRFRPFGSPSREDAQCVHCMALERHRLLWLFLLHNTDLFDGRTKRMLHVAPEHCLESRFKEELGDGYLTADLHNLSVMVKMDITNIEYPDQSFDVIYCSHVLEHVQNDRKAMSEFYRVLKDNGWAILLVPINAEATFEDSSITDPKDRLKIFGQEDHVRLYGPDFVDRLRCAGFHVVVFKADDLATVNEVTEMGLTGACGEIYYCTKQLK